MNKLIDAVKTFLSGVEYMEQEENANYVVTIEDKELLQEAIDTVVQQLEKPTYTPADMDSFAEWCRIEGFFYEVDNKIWCNYDTEPITEKTTTQLREDWEAKQKGEVADIPVKQKCPKCGDESYNSNGNYCLNSNCSLFFI